MLDYTAPSTVEEAIRILSGASGVAKLLSGGTDLLVQLRSGRTKPDLIVDTKKIPGMIGIREADGGFVIGAATPGAMIGECENLQKAWPGVVEAANLIGSTQIQGRATLAGNLCNASPGGGQRPGADRRARNLRGGGAEGAARGSRRGHRHGPRAHIAEPGRTDHRISPAQAAAAVGDAYLRFIPRTEMDIAVVGAGVNLTLDAERRLYRRAGGAGRRGADALLVPEAAAALVGHKLDEKALAMLDGAARRACKPIDDKRGTIEFRIKVAGVLARRAAAIAFERAGEATMTKHHVSATINGEPVEFLCEPQQTLLDVLRDELDLTGSKEGCGTGDCGACSVIVDGRLVCSCLVLGVEAEGSAIETIEGHGARHQARIRCSESSSSTRHCNAASARRAC